MQVGQNMLRYAARTAVYELWLVSTRIARLKVSVDDRAGTYNVFPQADDLENKFDRKDTTKSNRRTSMITSQWLSDSRSTDVFSGGYLKHCVTFADHGNRACTWSCLERPKDGFAATSVAKGLPSDLKRNQSFPFVKLSFSSSERFLESSKPLCCLLAICWYCGSMLYY